MLDRFWEWVEGEGEGNEGNVQFAYCAESFIPVCPFHCVLPILERRIETVLFQCFEVPKYPACIAIVLLADPQVLSGLPPSGSSIG